MDIWHLRFSSDGRHPLFPSERARRAAVVVLVRHAGPFLIAFGIVDDHLHVVVVCSRRRAGKLRRAILLGLRPIAGLGFEPSFFRPVESRGHLLRLMGYSIEQPKKHGLQAHPALWSGSSFSDLVGARLIDGLELRVADCLPRYRARDAWLSAECSAAGIQPVSESQILSCGLSSLRDAAAFSVCADPELAGRTIRETTARSIVVQLGRRAGFRSTDIAGALSVSSEAVRQLGGRPLDDRVLHATLLRMGIERSLTIRAKL